MIYGETCACSQQKRESECVIREHPALFCSVWVNERGAQGLQIPASINATQIAAFGLPPLSHEDDPLRGVKAAMVDAPVLSACWLLKLYRKSTQN